MSEQIDGEHATNSPKQTEALGARFARLLAPGQIVLLSGELGSGKTTFVRGAARVLGVHGPVTSPTFTIGQRYLAQAPFASVAHVDLYRLAGLAAEDPDLLTDYVGADTVTFVEWPDASLTELAGLGDPGHRIRFHHAGGDLRRIEITRSGAALTAGR